MENNCSTNNFNIKQKEQKKRENIYLGGSILIIPYSA